MTTVGDALTQKFGLGPIDQISFAVSSVDDALPRYEAMFGVGFFVIDVPGMEVVVRDRPETVDLRLAIGRSGGLEVELVEVVSGGWPTVAWLAEHGEGLHHLRYPVDDFARSRDEMLAAGCTPVMEGHVGDAAFGYLEVPLLNGMVVELIHMPS
jgi:methylmalonyl-CoA/ethylmalonyl-CoA epimerase